MSLKPTVHIAIIQARPVCFDLAGTVEKLADLAADAARDGAALVAVGETFLPGYPAWIDHAPRAMIWDNRATKDAFAQYRENSIVIPGPTHEGLSRLAARLGVAMVVGCSERVDHGPGHGTLYNTLLTYDADGALLNHHRKLVPTFTERVIWGPGDAAGLCATNTETVGRVGSLVCWEHWMPLARQTLHQSREDVHVAAWPWAHDKHQLASRQYAFEGRTHVLVIGQIQTEADVPEPLREAGRVIDPGALLLRGGSAVVAPDGTYVVEPVLDVESTIHAEIDLRAKDRECMTLDVTGHYARPDIFELTVSRADRLTTRPPA